MRVRVSIGNLAPRLRIEGEGSSRLFGILNKGAFEKGRHLINPLGGAALMTDRGKRLLEESFGAEFKAESMDARFFIDDEKLEKVLRLFEKRDPEFYEFDPLREVVEELSTKELSIQDQPVFTEEEVDRILLRFMKTVRQVPRNSGTSPLEVTGVISHRVFNLFTITIPAELSHKLKASPVIRFVTTDQALLAQNGVPQKTSDGWEIADNFML